MRTVDFGDIRRTDGWGQGLHGCDHVFSHTCNPDPVPRTAHLIVGYAIVAGCGILLWVITRSAFFALLVGLPSAAAAICAAVTYAGFRRFLGADADAAPHLMSVATHAGFGATMMGFLIAPVLAGYSVAARLRTRSQTIDR